MPLPVQSPGPAEQLEKRYAFKGGIRMFVDETIVPVEIILPRARKFAMGSAILLGGGAGLRGEVALTNILPFRSTIGDTSVQVHKIWIGSSAGNQYEIVIPTVALSGFTNLATKHFMDLNRGPGPSAALGEDNTAAATAAIRIWAERIGANSPELIEFTPKPLTLDGPDTNSVIVRCIQDNVALDVTYLWSEPADPA